MGRRLAPSRPREGHQPQPLLQGVGTQFEDTSIDYTEIAFALDELPSSPFDISPLLKGTLNRSIAANGSRMALLESSVVGSLLPKSNTEEGNKRIQACQLHISIQINQ
ncbi:hypothetical protein F5Y11DRAFT_367746 [Daldinia sp. FL1419]|nr:hypothetical protein F5Y11DRAFT_367746 [Daldinia sp. FL1419]